MATIDETAQNITAIIVAHRLSSIIDCDKIFVFERGRIVESGSHKSLLKKNGAYKSLWLAQQPPEKTGKSLKSAPRILLPAVSVSKRKTGLKKGEKGVS